MKKLLLFSCVLIATILLSSFVIEKATNVPKKGENLLAFYSPQQISKAYNDALKDKDVNDQLKEKAKELSKQAKRSLCYGVWSDDATMCKRDFKTQDNKTGSIASERKFSHVMA